MDQVRVLLNIIWLVLSGFWLALGYALAGVVMLIFIITIPFAIQAFKLAGYALWPFGRTVVKRPEAGGASVIGNVIWVVFAGWWLALEHILTAVPLAITIIGLPLAYANIKLVPVALWPFGREIVPAHEVEAAVAGSRGQASAQPIPHPIDATTDKPDRAT
jgi:uncharacterized membrane protein YccF (DUF307 family)